MLSLEVVCAPTFRKLLWLDDPPCLEDFARSELESTSSVDMIGFSLTASTYAPLFQLSLLDAISVMRPTTDFHLGLTFFFSSELANISLWFLAGELGSYFLFFMPACSSNDWNKIDLLTSISTTWYSWSTTFLDVSLSNLMPWFSI